MLGVLCSRIGQRLVTTSIIHWSPCPPYNAENLCHNTIFGSDISPWHVMSSRESRDLTTQGLTVKLLQPLKSTSVSEVLSLQSTGLNASFLPQKTTNNATQRQVQAYHGQ